MKGLLIRAGRALKYKVVHPEKRYGVRHVSGWIEAEKITGASVAEVDWKINELLGPKVHALSIDRIAAGFRLPENFGDFMRNYLRNECRIIDKATGKPIEKRGAFLMMIGTGLINGKQVVR